MSEFKTKLPQEGTAHGGESLSVLHSSDSPTDSGGGKFRIQQPLNKKLLVNRQRSNSFSGAIVSADINELTSNSSQNQHNTLCSQESTWTEVTGKKRQRSSPETVTSRRKQTKITSYWLSNPTPTSNRYSELIVEQEQAISNEAPIKTPRPPPIFVDKVENIQPLVTLLNEHAKDDYILKVLQKYQVKIQPNSPEIYSKIVKLLEERETEFYTYKPKQERSFKVVLKNMHHSTDIEEIKNALMERGHFVTNIWNIKQRNTKKPLPIFIIELKPDTNNKEVYNIKTLLHCRMYFEPPRPAREIPQCSNCQQYGHTKKYCRRKPKCIKCAGDHLSALCSRKGKLEDVKCVLCEGNHPANYKGCHIYRQLQKIKFPPPREKRTSNFTNNKPTITATETQTTKNISYAQAVKNDTKDSNLNDMKEMIEMFKQIMIQLSTMNNLLITLTNKISHSVN